MLFKRAKLPSSSALVAQRAGMAAPSSEKRDMPVSSVLNLQILPSGVPNQSEPPHSSQHRAGIFVQ